MATAEIIGPLDRHKEGHIEAMWKGATIPIRTKQEPQCEDFCTYRTVTAAFLSLSFIFIVLLYAFESIAAHESTQAY